MNKSDLITKSYYSWTSKNVNRWMPALSLYKDKFYDNIFNLLTVIQYFWSILITEDFVI